MITKNISDIISVQNSCKEIIQELYKYEARPDEAIRANYKSAKIDEAIRLEIIEYDSYDDELTLSSDTQDYYKTRLGQNDETNIGIIGEKIDKLKILLQIYNIRVKKSENFDKEIKSIYKILNQIPSLLKYNLQAISSSSIFAFKNESNFDIKLLNLNISKDEITQLINASKSVDTLLDEEYNFFKSMDSRRITSAILKLKHNSLVLEDSFRRLYEEIKNFINQAIKDGQFIKKLKKLKELKDANALSQNTNIEELAYKKRSQNIVTNVREKRLHPDDKIHDYIETMRRLMQARELMLKNTKPLTPIEYDITKVVSIKKRLYNYEKLNREFLEQDRDLISFLKMNNIQEERLLGVFVRMIKNYSPHYITDNDTFITIDKRVYAEIFSVKKGDL